MADRLATDKRQYSCQQCKPPAPSASSPADTGLLYQFWTNPESVRRKVLASRQMMFRDVQGNVESARLRLFGGIEVKEVRLSRKGDLDHSDFLYVPSATIFHDKEHVLEDGLR